MSIITNPEILSKNYLPEKLLYREKEKNELLSNLRNFMSVIVYGTPGTGKTSLVKHVFKSLDSKVLRSYINCALYQTTYSILKEITPRAKFIFCRSNYELLKELMREIKQRRLVVCFDNFEKLKEKDLIKKFLLLGITLVLITDEEENLLLLPEDVRTNSARIKFEPYSLEQTFDILKNRAEKALARWSYSDSLLKKIAEKCKGNVALGINLLKLAAINAESKNKKTIDESDIPQIEDCPLKLSYDEKTLLKILKEHKSLPASKLFELYVQNSKHPKGERSFRNYMRNLCLKGLVRAIGEKRGRFYEIVEGDLNFKGNG